MKDVSSLSDSSNLIFQNPLLSSSAERNRGSPTEAKDSAVSGNVHESPAVTALSAFHSVKKYNIPSFFAARTSVPTHLVRAGSKMFIDNKLSITEC